MKNISLIIVYLVFLSCSNGVDIKEHYYSHEVQIKKLYFLFKQMTSQNSHLSITFSNESFNRIRIFTEGYTKNIASDNYSIVVNNYTNKEEYKNQLSNLGWNKEQVETLSKSLKESGFEVIRRIKINNDPIEVYSYNNFETLNIYEDSVLDSVKKYAGRPISDSGFAKKVFIR